MVLRDIAVVSNYVAADESMNTSNIISYANGCISEINTKTGTNLPFFVQANYDTTEYDAVSDSWLLRLVEPYLSYMIMSNDDNAEQRNFHYRRFLDAVSDFKSKGYSAIKLLTSLGAATGYEGSAVRSVVIGTSDRTVTYQRW